MHSFRKGDRVRDTVLRPDAFSFWASWAQLPHVFSRVDRGGRGEGQASATPALGLTRARCVDPAELGYTTSADSFGADGAQW